MGLHSGVALSTDMTFNRTTQSMAYSGYPMKVAKIVGDSAAGGMVLLSSTTFTQLASQLGALPGSPLPVYMGDADLGLDAASGLGGPMPLFALVVPELRPRFAHQEALRGLTITQVTQRKGGHTRKWDRSASLHALLHPFFRKHCFGWALDDAWLRLRGSFMYTDRHLAGPRAVICSKNRRCEAKEHSAGTVWFYLSHFVYLLVCLFLQLGNLDAPLGSVAIVFVYVVGASALIAELGDLATQALEAFQVSGHDLCYSRVLFAQPSTAVGPST
jgi:hypothetical protein